MNLSINFLFLALYLFKCLELYEIKEGRKFSIDYKNNTFLMDDQPFRYVSGSFHYFRALPETWKTKLHTMRSAGLNAVDTYVEWSLHNPKDEIYNFDGIADIVKFIEFAVEEDLYVILRPGPYICAERDNGGLPYWLFSKYPNIKPRTSDPNYIYEISKWYAILMPYLQKYLYGNGGPIIMVQIENEYGAFHACDRKYLNWLRDETIKYVKNKAVLFTTDIPNDKIACGKIEDVFATIDFGAERANEFNELWKILRSVQAQGPLVNSEFYTGWLTHWQEENQRRDPIIVSNAFRKILEVGASINFYMFFGGTNFGFTAGANDFGHGKYTPDITSYDYDAIMDEAGDPTKKFHMIRDVIKDFLPLPNITIPEKKPKMALGKVSLEPVTLLLSNISKKILCTKTMASEKLLSFEELNQYSGLVLYEINIPKLTIDPTLLTIEKLQDRAIILIDGKLIGILSRENAINSLPISAGFGSKLQILVENQGRINFNITNDMKGIFGNITVKQSNGLNEILKGKFHSSSYPLEGYQLQELVKHSNAEIYKDLSGPLLEGPMILYGKFTLNQNNFHDTYLDTSGWGKGVAYLNGFNLGRYWPLVGPQVTLYVPKELFHSGDNEIIFVEYQRIPKDKEISFVDTPQLDGK